MRKSLSHKPALQEGWQKYGEMYEKFRNAGLKEDFDFSNVVFQATVMTVIPYLFSTYMYAAIGPRRRHLGFPKKRNRNI